MTTTKLELLPHQREHASRINDILDREFSYLDTSPMGAGKTYICGDQAIRRDLALLVICPLSAISMWRKFATTYGIPLVDAMTYQSLRGTKASQPKHKLLERETRTHQRKRRDKMGREYLVDYEENHYHPTQKYLDLVNQGLLLVFDEVHNLKNPTDQQRAAHGLVKGLIRLSYQPNFKSRIALLSATPFDKAEHAEAIVRMLGIITCDKLYQYNKSNWAYEYQDHGLGQLEAKCAEFDPALTDGAFRGIGVCKRTASELCHKLLVHVIGPRMFSHMEPPHRTLQTNDGSSIEQDIKDAYYPLDEESGERLEDGVRLLVNTFRYNENSDSIDCRKVNWGDITMALIMIEQSKLMTFMRLAQQQLDREDCKVIIYCHYVDNIKWLAQVLEAYRPLVMYGQTRPKQRDQIIERFQHPDGEYRLLISNPKVGGIGISLDDRDGRWPRYMFIAPNYNFIDLYQATGRIYRSTTRSKATVRFVYGGRISRTERTKDNGAENVIGTDANDSVSPMDDRSLEPMLYATGSSETLESAILQALARKANVTSELVSINAASKNWSPYGQAETVINI